MATNNNNIKLILDIENQLNNLVVCIEGLTHSNKVRNETEKYLLESRENLKKALNLYAS